MGGPLPTSGFGLRAERERRGLPPELTMPERGEPEPEPAPKRGGAGAGAEVTLTVTPVLNQEALVAICDQITAAVRDAFQQGVSAGIAEAEALIADHEL